MAAEGARRSPRIMVASTGLSSTNSTLISAACRRFITTVATGNYPLCPNTCEKLLLTTSAHQVQTPYQPLHLAFELFQHVPGPRERSTSAKLLQLPGRRDRYAGGKLRHCPVDLMRHPFQLSGIMI